MKNEEVVQRVNKILVGWGNYFQCGYPRKAFDKVNWYVRNRLYLHFNRKSQRGYVLTKNGEARFEGSRRPSGRSPRGVPLYSTPILDPSSSLKRFSSFALVTRLIVIIGRFVPSRPQWNECSSSHFRESVNSGRVIAANTTENEGELNHHGSSSKPAIVRSFEGWFFGLLGGIRKEERLKPRPD